MTDEKKPPQTVAAAQQTGAQIVLDIDAAGVGSPAGKLLGYPGQQLCGHVRRTAFGAGYCPRCWPSSARNSG